MNELNKENSCIDLMKLIASIMIFALHCQAFSDLGHFSFIWELLSRWGVPYFFIASSFFLFNNHTDSVQVAQKYISRILILYLIWFIFNIPSIYVLRLHEQDLTNLNTWLVFIKNSLLSSTFTGSWYLLSCVFCALVIPYISRIFNTKVLIFISSIVQLLCVFSSIYVGILPNFIQRILNFLNFPLNVFGGMLYFSLGKWLAENKNYFLKKSKNIYLIIILCSYILYVLEILISKKTGLYSISDQAFSLIPLSFCLFIVSLQSTLKLKKAKMLRKASTIIYCAQSNILIFASALRKIFHIDNSLFVFFLSCIVMMIIVSIIMFFQSQKKYKLFQYFT